MECGVGWLGTIDGSLVVRASDLRLNGREFDPRQPHYRSVGSGMGEVFGRTHNLGM